ncbi:hypothetical protein FIV42_16005 [Persicimonas caeni]|uniref:Uncharacterized protein n=1 Tax=Persicimonas caeni TaxID=2292766 RepID=A0A4Y6PVP4_PERCE|nr:hypothetical protein [Persicimonas caeni]QDG52189.1 hypothetical protein FIV42_16005 [Persicimonas caeni]QED33411.1 hypothetical protein FRD00_16000 [Persicimonas caeni]
MKHIASKLNAIRQSIARLEPSAPDAARSDASLYDAVRRELVRHRVEWLPSLTLVSREETDTETMDGLPELRHLVELEVVYVDCDSGESLTQVWSGESIHHDEEGIQMAADQAVEAALSAQFMLGSADDAAAEPTRSTNHHIHLLEVAPAAPASAIIERLHDLGLSDEQVGLFGQWMADMEEVDDISEISRARMLAWYQRLSASSDDELLTKVMDAVATLDAVA